MSDGQKTEVGKITHFFPKIGVAVVELSKPLNVGDRISIEGKDQAFEQDVGSMQVEHENITTANPGQSIGLKVAQLVRPGDKVYKI